MSAFDAKLKPTDEQQEIIDVVHTGVDTVIEAGAGAGKTSQLKMVAENEAHRRGLCIYFNKEPAAQARRTFPTNIACSTAHSLAWNAMKDHPAMQRLNGDRVTAKMLAEDYLGITKWFKTPPGRKDISTWKIASMAVNAVKRFCYSDAAKIEPWHVERIEGIDGDLEKEAARGGAALRSTRSGTTCRRPTASRSSRRPLHEDVGATGSPSSRPSS
jgi:hypothetical protein